MVKLRFLLILISICIYPWNLYAQPNEAFRTFWHPTYQGERVDYCTADGQQCGKAVAHRYCQILGYDYSNQAVIAHNVGLTNYLNTRLRCTGWRCTGFMTIGCAKKMAHNPPAPYHYRERRFAVPRYNDYRVDWCYDTHKHCGAKAAHSFCSRMGYIRAKQFRKQSMVGATKTIGSQELCFGNQCSAFKTIVCYR